MSILRPLLIVVVVAGVAWWLLSDSDEGRVRQAHEQLVSLLSKPAEESNAAGLLNARTLQGEFAASVEITGAAGALAGSYTPDQLASISVQIRALFDIIDLTFGELTISFPEDGIAITGFNATLIGIPVVEGEGAIQEVRSVTSTMLKLDGTWLFASFSLIEP